MSSIALIGNVNADLIVSPVAELPPPGAERSVDSIEARVGGAAANTALALARLGVRPRLVGCVGDDAFGRFVHDELAAAGLADDLVLLPGAPTGICLAFEAPGRDRAFLTALGSLAAFTATLVPAEALRARFVLLCGYFLLPALRGEPARALLGAARAAGATTLLDCGDDLAGWPAETRAEIGGLLPVVDVFLPNEAEAVALTGEDDPLAAARALQRVSGGVVVVKLGPRGCLALFRDGAVERVAAPPVKVRDTTGAGDAFNAGLLFALGEGREWPAALSFAVRLASTVVARPSAVRHPPVEEVLGA